MRNDKKRFLKRSFQIFASSFIGVAIIGAFVFVTKGRDIPVLDPKGTIAAQEYQLILITIALGVLIVVPVFILLFFIAWRYRADNKKAKYEPELEGSRILEILWWGIPIVVILVLAVITYISTHALDPYKELESNQPPITVQVIALESNWLFIYPDYNAATLNYLNIPEETPINLSITSDAPMNSFWVPALSGQVYAMSGMTTKLHFMADDKGTFNGASANISGEDYADMTFKVNALGKTEFELWVRQAAASRNTLSNESYTALVKADANQSEKAYAITAASLFDTVIMKYMHGDSKNEASEDEHHMEGMSH